MTARMGPRPARRCFRKVFTTRFQVACHFFFLVCFKLHPTANVNLRPRICGRCHHSWHHPRFWWEWWWAGSGDTVAQLGPAWRYHFVEKELDLARWHLAEFCLSKTQCLMFCFNLQGWFWGLSDLSLLLQAVQLKPIRSEQWPSHSPYGPPEVLWKLSF